MKYVRTENGIFEVLSEYDTPENTTLISNPVRAFDVKVTSRTYSGASIRIIYSNEVIKQADTIEDLFMKGDLLVVGNESEMPIFIESIEYLKRWLYCHDIYKIKEFYIKHGNDYHLAAKMNKEGVLCLL